ncbi:MAG: hypothetical protein A2148_10860 [Chloroflexi bacterium RBG_16_68_14]|nr:MAG: hypothetical protein A2148_10860 [Chloroflexi bacterium RBG_16_68_14]
MIAPEVERLRSIHDFKALIRYLREELDWPIAEHVAEEDMVYDYTPEEVGLDPPSAVKIDRIVRLRPLVAGQPWGIFYIDFRPGKLPVTVLRRILRALVIKKRESRGDKKLWELDDLLFISRLGEDGDRSINLAHFSEDGDGSGRATLRVVDWDEEDSHFHMLRTAEELHRLRWPEDPSDAETWRETWASAFALKLGEVAKTSKQLALEMAHMARLIRGRVNAAMAVESDKGPLRRMYKAFQEVLLHDLTEDDFADMYAQTITYGLFAARRSRPIGITAENAADMVPPTNPFLRDLLAEFTEVGGLTKTLDFDELGIDALVQMLNNANMEAVVADFGDKNPLEDPVIHFYELFLKEYDPKKRVQRGIFFTPRPVVSFIVRSVDELLRTEFGLEDGLADTTTWGEMIERHPHLTLPNGTKPETPFVQILDPAVGTGTFLVEVINVVHRTMFDKWRREGHLPMLDIPQLWNDYVANHLLPRLYGFELMMAPYAIAHMKIGLKLEETGYKTAKGERLRIYLTNSLEPPWDPSGQFEEMVPALAHEAVASEKAKSKTAFTVIIGNPPYAKESANTGPWIADLLRESLEDGADSFFKVDGATLGERNPKWLNDDYVKFIRYGQYRIAKSAAGVLGFITNDGYLGNPTFRGMRQSLATTFSRIFVLDLHGEARRVEERTSAPDENVFDIKQPVAIGLFCNGLLREDTVSIAHADLVGPRSEKYSILQDSSAGTITWQTLSVSPPFYLYRPQNEELWEEYQAGLPVPTVFRIGTVGIVTGNDAGAIAISLNEARELADAAGLPHEAIRQILYRPFDWRFILYDPTLVGRRRYAVMQHMLSGRNLALVTARSNKSGTPDHFLVTRVIMEAKCGESTTQSALFPLFTDAGFDGLSLDDGLHSNLDANFVRTLGVSVGRAVSPEDVLHYAYGLFYSRLYRQRYGEFLRVDFPRIIAPQDPSLFSVIASLGADLVALHLLDDDYQWASWNSGNASNPLTRTNIAFEGGARGVGNVYPKYHHCSVALNPSSHFNSVPEDTWHFTIGGYQVCHKWLKDRRGRTLADEDLRHYIRIVVAIQETIRLMSEVDSVIQEHGGWPFPKSLAARD